MKILHVLTAPRAQGTPRLVLDWIAVGDHDHEILFLSPEGNIKQTFQDTGVWQFYNNDFTLGYQSIPRLVGLVKRICRERRPDLVISWTFGFSHWVTIGARIGGVRKILAHCGNPPGNGFMKKYFQTYLCFYLGWLLGNKVVACSKFVREQYRQLLPGKFPELHVVYNALRTDRFYVPPGHDDSGRRDVSMIGYLEEARDHRTLLHAWKEIEDRIPGVTLNVIGDGTLREELESLSQKLELKRVNFTGRVDVVREYLWKTRVYAFSTLHEGFGTSLLEALAAGCFVVATDVPACREVLQDGRYGILVPIRDPRLFADAILQSWFTERSEEKLNEQLDYAKTFSPKRMMEGYIKVAALIRGK